MVTPLHQIFFSCLDCNSSLKCVYVSTDFPVRVLQRRTSRSGQHETYFFLMKVFPFQVTESMCFEKKLMMLEHYEIH